MSSDKSYVHLDHTVVFTFLALIGVFSLLLGFRIITDTECKEVELFIPTKMAKTGELVQFENKSKFTKSQVWNFGDSTDGSIMRSPSHTFSKPGEYEITLTVNNKCVGTEYITIIPPESTYNPALVPKISARRDVVVGQKVEFTAKVPPGTKKWEWRFGDSSSVGSFEESPVHIYDSPGPRTVTLIINDDLEHASRFKVNVDRRKYTPDPKKTYIPYEPLEVRIDKKRNQRQRQLDDQRRRDSLANLRKKNEQQQLALENVKAPSISDAELLQMFKNYGENIVERSVFNPYICEQGDIPITVITRTGEYTAPLSYFLDVVQDRGKKIKIQHMHTQLDENNCIVGITMKGKGFGFKR